MNTISVARSVRVQSVLLSGSSASTAAPIRSGLAQHLRGHGEFA
ncbi:hypothetical protein [Amycolatopsis palatopharyngis]|nr:hypothetical protein [Amycolatopsis palatopharyngis]